MSEPYLGQITMFAGNFAPQGYAFCNGQILAISQNQTLFSLIGATYGGDGRTNFALPDLRSRLPLHMGQGSGLSSYQLGQAAGQPTVTLTLETMPAHSHALTASRSLATTGAIDSVVVPAIANGAQAANFYATQGAGQPPLDKQAMDSAVCDTSGGSQPHSNLMPSLTISFVIALQGLFPPRN